MDKVIKLVLNRRAMIGICPETIERDMFNAYDEQYLYCSMNESTAGAKSMGKANPLIAQAKRQTDGDGAIRAHQEGLRDGHQFALWNMNTNESDLNGMTYELNKDAALRSRLSIQWWRKQDKTQAEKRDIEQRYLHNPNAGYSIYRYLLEELDITNYDPGRYQNEEKDLIITALLASNKSPLQEFVEYLDAWSPNDYTQPQDVNHNIIRTYTQQSRNATESYEYIIETEFKKELKKDKNITLKAETLQSELKLLGWDYGKKKVDVRVKRVFYRQPQLTTDDNVSVAADDASVA
jgi:hypothetical protein